LTLVEVLVVTAILGLLAAVLIPNYYKHARDEGYLSACKSNLKSVATALELYSTGNDGRFPVFLTELSPQYLIELPTCPAVGQDTYSDGYVSNSNPDLFTVVCEGNNHSGVDGIGGTSAGGAGSNLSYPQYCSSQGLIDR